MQQHVSKVGGTYGDWYVGIATDPKERLFSGHGVHEKDDAWFYQRALSSEAARRIEKHFLDLGMDGGAGGGDASSDYA